MSRLKTSLDRPLFVSGRLTLRNRKVKRSSMEPSTDPDQVSSLKRRTSRAVRRVPKIVNPTRLPCFRLRNLDFELWSDPLNNNVSVPVFLWSSKWRERESQLHAARPASENTSNIKRLTFRLWLCQDLSRYHCFLLCFSNLSRFRSFESLASTPAPCE